MTKLGLFCEKIIEAGLILALVVSPLIINRFGENQYDMVKGTVVRSIALVVLVAFIIRRLEGYLSPTRPPTGPTGQRARYPLLLPAGLLMGLSYLVSTIFSVTPHTSWWGHPGARDQGAYTILSYIVIFFITALTLRSREQLRRIIDTIILTSVIVCIYGLWQAAYFRPIQNVRIDATIGNPIFFGSYLVLVIPLTLARVIEIKGSSLIGFLVILLLQIVCLILTQSRGPLVGLFTGLAFFLTLWFIKQGRRKLVLLLYSTGIILLIFLMVFNIPGGPLASLQKIPYFGRLGQIFETQGGAGKVRLLIWEGTLRMAQAEPTRAILGYGPEMMKVMYYKYAEPELVTFERRVAFPDRAHNDLYDILATNGLVGVVVYVIIIGLLLWYLLTYLGRAEATHQKRIFIILVIISILTGLILPYLLTGSLIYSGLGLVFGIIGAGGLYLLIYLLKPPTGSPRRPSQTITSVNPVSLPATSSWQAELWLIAIGSALLGHFAELQFGINVNSSAFYGWFFLGLFVAVSRLPQDRPPERTSENRTHSLFYPILASIISLILLYTFVQTIHPVYERAPREFLLDSLLSTISGYSLKGSNLWLIVSFIVGLSALPLVGGFLQRAHPTRVRTHLKFFITYFSIITSTGLLFLITHAWLIYLPGIITQGNIVKNIGEVTLRSETITNLYIWLGLGLVGLTWWLYKSDPADRDIPFWRWGNSIIYLILIILTPALVIHNDLNLLRANNLFNIAAKFQRDKLPETALAVYRQAGELAPDPTYTYASIAESYRIQAETEPNPVRKLELLDQALKELQKSLEYEPLSWVRNANLARLYRFRHQLQPDGPTRHYVENYYHRALSLCPNNPELVNELGEFYTELKDYTKAVEVYQRSSRIDKSFPETLVHLGDVALEMGKKEEALKYYSPAVELYQTSDLSFIHPNQDNLYVRAHERLIELAPGNYAAYWGLARWRANKGNRAGALDLARQALPLAPPEKQEMIRSFIRQLGG